MKFAGPLAQRRVRSPDLRLFSLGLRFLMLYLANSSRAKPRAPHYSRQSAPCTLFELSFNSDVKRAAQAFKIADRLRHSSIFVVQ